MTATKLTSGRPRDGCFSNQTVAVFTVFCAMVGVFYVTGAFQAVYNMTHSLQERSSLPKPAEPLVFKTAAVATDYKTCSEYGTNILQVKHGNAVDAAIATALCAGVVNAHSCGIGGGGFMIIYDKKKGKTTAIDFREETPELEHVENIAGYERFINDWKKGDGKVPRKGKFVGVPGELRGFETAWKKHGSLPWKDLFEPAIEMATKGFRAPRALVNAVRLNAGNISLDHGLRELFKPNGRFIKEGELIRRTKYGKTLQKIANSNVDVFYTGNMGKQIVKDLNSVGSKISLKDLKDYKAREIAPLVASLPGVKGYKILTMPPPAGGASLINILNILKGFKFTGNDRKEKPILTYHRMIEAFNFDAAKRTYLQDPDYSSKVMQVVDEMINPEKGEELRKLIDDKTTHSFDYYGPINYNTDVTDGTSHLSVIDKDGNAVALTTSINHYFGAFTQSPELGIIYNDQLWDAVNIWAKKYNLHMDSLKPHKRPMSLAAPSIILDDAGNVNMVIGAAGGKYIATALSQVLMNYYWFGDSLKDAVAKPRLHSQLFPDVVLVEPTFPKKYVEGLERFGHNITTNTKLITGLQLRLMKNNAMFYNDGKEGIPYQSMGVVQIIVKAKTGAVLALADHRKGGGAAGYR